MAASITSQDREHMRAFSAEQKSRIMREIMSRYPVAERNYVGNTHFVKTILKLRADGLRLIDLQAQETAFTSVWYKKSGSLLGRGKADIAAMVVWAANASEDDMTTVRVWRI
jgi:hypothetical protein